MKVFSQAACLIAIVSQIFLSSLAFSHDVACPLSASDVEQVSDVESEVEGGHSDQCGCSYIGIGHSHLNQEETHTDTPSLPCTCSSESLLSFILSDSLIVVKESLVSFISKMSFSKHERLLAESTLWMNQEQRSSSDEREFIYLAECSGENLRAFLCRFLI